MGQLRDRMQADLKIGGYSPSTQKVYLLYARQFAAHFMRSPAEMGVEQVDFQTNRTPTTTTRLK